MRTTGIVRNIDSLGRVVIPVEIRRTMKVQNGDPVEMYMVDGEVRVRRYAGSTCAACGQNKATKNVGMIGICDKCAATVKAG